MNCQTFVKIRTDLLITFHTKALIQAANILEVQLKQVSLQLLALVEESKTMLPRKELQTVLKGRKCRLILSKRKSNRVWISSNLWQLRIPYRMWMKGQTVEILIPIPSSGITNSLNKRRIKLTSKEKTILKMTSPARSRSRWHQICLTLRTVLVSLDLLLARLRLSNNKETKQAQGPTNSTSRSQMVRKCHLITRIANST